MDRYLDRLHSPMMKFFDIIYKLVILNVLFILHALMGLVVFGLYPSLLATYKLSKRVFVDKEEGVKYFKEFFKIFKQNLVKDNLLFLVVLLIGVITVFDVIFIYNNYLQVDEITFTGLLLSMGGILLAFVVFGVIALVGVVKAFYPNFNHKEALRFAFFQTLSSPFLILTYVFIAIIGYFSFSVLISAAPFIGVSLPIYLQVLQYKKTYKRIFLVEEKDGYQFMSFRYNKDNSKFIDVLNGVLANEFDVVNSDAFMQAIKQKNIDLKESIVVLDRTDNVIGMELVSVEESTCTIELLAIHKNNQRKGLGTHLVNRVLNNPNYSIVKTTTNKENYHESLSQIGSLNYIFRKLGFTEVTPTEFELRK